MTHSYIENHCIVWPQCFYPGISTWDGCDVTVWLLFAFSLESFYKVSSHPCPTPILLCFLFAMFLYKPPLHHHASLLIVSLSPHRNTSKRGETFGISRIGSKIKGVFKSTTMEGAMLPSSGLVEGEDDLVSDAQPVENWSSPLYRHLGTMLRKETNPRWAAK